MGEPIDLIGERKDGTIRIAIADSGPGIPAAELPHIFEKFYRGAGAKHAQGTGLGLAIVKSMVELCTGSVQVQSNAHGSTFSLTLPAAGKPQA